MTLQSSGTISLSQIRAEFGGGTGSISLSQLYAGGSRVPADAAGKNGAIPAAGAISLSNFYGSANAVVQNNSYYFIHSSGISISYTFNRNGSVTCSQPTALHPNWFGISRSSVGDEYQIMFSNPPSAAATQYQIGTYNVWQSLSNSVTIGTGSTYWYGAFITYSIRNASTGTVLVTNTIQLT